MRYREVVPRTPKFHGCGDWVPFKSSSHGDHLLEGLTRLRDMEKLFDVVLIVENERLPAHRVVLASCSDYFRAMFTDGLMESSQDEIRLNGVSATGIRNIIDFAYSSKIVIDEDNVEDILFAANHVRIEPVIDACVKFLEHHLVHSNCVDLVGVAELFSLKHLKTKAYRYISERLSSLSLTPEFQTLTPSQLEELLQRNYPVNCTECDVLAAVIGYVVHHFGYNGGASQALNYVRFLNIQGISSEELDAMHNRQDLERLCSDPLDGELLQTFVQAINSSNTIYIPGLVNIRGFKNSVIVCGGFQDGQGMTSAVYHFNETGNELAYLTSVPHVEQCNFGLTTLDNRMYIAGGCYNDDQLEEITHGYGFCYDPVSTHWFNIAPMAQERCRFYLGAVGNKLYAIGGDPSASTHNTDFADCECYNPETDSWSAIAGLPGNRMEHAGTTMDDCLYISGGLQDLDGHAFNTFFKYDPNADMWSQLPSMPRSRSDHTMFHHEGKIYVIGGCCMDASTHRRVVVPTIDRFDFDTGQWETVGFVPCRRLYASYTLVGDQLVMAGGRTTDYTTQCQDVYTWCLGTRVWERTRGATGGIWEHASCALYIPANCQD